jgi:uncharacterized cupin superfamily protein
MNLLDCPTGEPEEIPGFLHRRAYVGQDLGAQQLGCTLYEVPPGERLWPYHWHVGNEEWLVVVSGAPTLRTPEGEHELRAGDVAAFAADESGAHDVSNRSDEPARVAIFSTLRPGNTFYPDSDKVGAGKPGERRYFRRGDAVDYWEGERG